MDDTLLAHSLKKLDLAIFLKDCDGRYLMMNENGAEMIGHSVASVLVRNDFSLFERDSAERIIKRDNAILSGGCYGMLDYKSWARLPGEDGETLFHSFKTALKGRRKSTILGVSFVDRGDKLQNYEMQILIKEMMRLRLSLILKSCVDQMRFMVERKQVSSENFTEISSLILQKH